MAAPVECPSCGSWNPPQSARCRGCGRELRGPQIAFEGPPPDVEEAVRRVEADEQGRERRTAAYAESMRTEREEARAGERKRRKYERDKRMAELAARTASSKPAPDSEESDVRTEAPEEPPTSRVEPVSTGLAGPRVPTHVAGLDEALGGGIPLGFVVVLEGAPGTMKSSIGFWVLAQNAIRDGRRGLYVTCEESGTSLLRQMAALGLDATGAGERVKILDAPFLGSAIRSAKEKDWMTPLRDAVESWRDDGGLDLLVLDSLDGLESLAAFEDRRQEVFRLFEWLRDLGVTAFVVAERADYVVQGHVLQARHVENFLADGVINLRLHLVSELEAQRRIRIVKMRATRHATGYLALQTGGGELEVARALGA